jgi:tRNA G18 (ribose-2'-O)-methylase SpoU
LPAYVQAQCDEIISIDSVRDASYNVAVAGSIVLYHRLLNLKAGAQ